MDPFTRSSLLVRYAVPDRLRNNGVSRETFAAIYRGEAPWEIGQPQPEMVALEKAGKIRGAVLDVGCGTGETTLFLAARGYDVLGIDFVPEVVEQARAKALQRQSGARFAVHDALELAALSTVFDTVIDSATFHAFSDAQRGRYAAALQAAMRPDATLYLLCFADREGYVGGPRHISQAEIRNTFADGWEVVAIREVQYLATIIDGGAQAWLAEVRRR